MRLPGVEPGSIAWKAIILTVGLQTLGGNDASQLQIAESTQDQHRLVSRTNNRIPGTLGFLDLLSCLLYKIQPSIICQLHAAWSRRVHLVYGLHDPISSKFGSFVVEKPAKTLIPSQIVTLNLLCGCSDQSTRDIDVVTYRIESGDTLLTICLQFMADVNETAELNGLTNPNLILAGDVMFIPGPGKRDMT
ncbi:hypothetical protein Ddye_007330 [Dipteronia dyeriana]|uniref:LysM domain-containing protein n=1 Tax=Dipteronia dyeriana TaxID=168575 RepID=A0AAD9XKC7_9ROSI|nr:hypothetical protein Ddye_007330 [Dipteronia dyeriana]